MSISERVRLAGVLLNNEGSAYETLYAGEDYLEAVLILQKKLGMVRSVDVARYMEVSKPSVCYAVGTLREGGFLTTDKNHYLHLTDLARRWLKKFTSAIVF